MIVAIVFVPVALIKLAESIAFKSYSARDDVPAQIILASVWLLPAAFLVALILGGPSIATSPFFFREAAGWTAAFILILTVLSIILAIVVVKSAQDDVFSLDWKGETDFYSWNRTQNGKPVSFLGRGRPVLMAMVAALIAISLIVIPGWRSSVVALIVIACWLIANLGPFREVNGSFFCTILLLVPLTTFLLWFEP